MDYTVVSATETAIFCEKADLERHEKESPSDEECSCSQSTDESAAISLTKRNKTMENIAVVASCTHLSETNAKLNKTNENNLVIASSSNSSHSEAVEFTTKADKMNENNSMIAVPDLRNEVAEETTLDDNHKLRSATNCDHKTNLNIANETWIQTEKSCSKSSTKMLKLKNVLSDQPITSHKQNPNCEYRVRCLRFRDFLGLPRNKIFIFFNDKLIDWDTVFYSLE